MNTGQISKWLTIFANFGVLIGIFVVVVEINQNTTAIQTDIAWSRAQWVLDYNLPSSTNPDLAKIEMEFATLSAEEVVSRAGSEEAYRLAVRINTDRIYQETRYLTRTSTEERRVQRNQMLSRCSPYVWVMQTALGYDDLNVEYAEFLRDIVAEIKTTPCIRAIDRVQP